MTNGSHGEAAPRVRVGKPEPTPLGYVLVWVALLVLLGLTFWLGHVDLGPWNIVVALGIAVLKAVLVAAFFMHLAHDDPLSTVLIVAGVLFLLLVMGLTLVDAMHRG